MVPPPMIGDKAKASTTGDARQQLPGNPARRPVEQSDCGSEQGLSGGRAVRHWVRTIAIECRKKLAQSARNCETRFRNGSSQAKGRSDRTIGPHRRRFRCKASDQICQQMWNRRAPGDPQPEVSSASEKIRCNHPSKFSDRETAICLCRSVWER